MGYYYPGMQPVFYSNKEHVDNSKLKSDYESSRFVYGINLMDILNGKDFRTTIMIKNIPNKYTQKMILKKINKEFKRYYDFFYLPIDLKNKCNVGYAFINFIHPIYILRFFEVFNGQGWEKFQSDTICQLTYARLHGHQTLMIHFQSSNSMFQQSLKVRPMILSEMKVDFAEIEEYEKKIRIEMTEKKIMDLMNKSYSIFGK